MDRVLILVIFSPADLSRPLGVLPRSSDDCVLDEARDSITWPKRFQHSLLYSVRSAHDSEDTMTSRTPLIPVCTANFPPVLSHFQQSLDLLLGPYRTLRQAVDHDLALLLSFTQTQFLADLGRQEIQNSFVVQLQV